MSGMERIYQIDQILSSRQSISRKELQDRLGISWATLKRDIAYTTVMTTMVRLSEKGLLKIVDKSGLANLYSPVEGREQFIRNSVNWVLDIFFEEFPEESATYLAEATRRRFEKKPTKKR